MAQSALDILGQIRGGYALHKFSEKLAEATLAARTVGKKATVTLTIEVSPDKTDESVVSVQPKITCKIPEKGFAEAIFFVDEKGKLSKEDPKQAEMFEERRKQGVVDIAAQDERIMQVGRGTTAS